MLRKRTMISAAVAGDDFVDLGLPSGLLWAKGNIISDGNGGYKVGGKTDYGAYFSWGNIVPHFSSNGSTFDDGYDFGTSINGPYAQTPGASLIAKIPINDAQHDAALALLGSPWHIPTTKDFRELYNNTDSEWTTINGITGRKFMKKSNHSVYVFFPAASRGYSTSIAFIGQGGLYWSGTFNYNKYAFYMTFDSSSVNPVVGEPLERFYGFPVRAVTLPFAPLSLHFQDGSGNAIVGLSVNITDGNGTHTMTTDSSGNIVMNVVRGNVTLSSGAYQLDITTINVSTDTSAVITGTSVMVDLGLPSGLLWAKGNIVKDANGNYAIGNETDWGTYISWGNIIGHNEGEGYSFDQTTYDSTPGKNVSADIPSNDAAHDFALAVLGAPYHLPTGEQMEEMYANTDNEWTTINGVAGCKFMKKTDHSVYVFLPAGGCYNGTTLKNRETEGRYRTNIYQSSTYTKDYISTTSSYGLTWVNRFVGTPVRPVQ